MEKPSDLLNFEIDHIDPLGQGVFKDEDGITFIPKTLPGEKGTAQLYKKSKGVSFAKLEEVKEPSPIRIQPICPHFQTCPGCHFLHTHYENEIGFKTHSLFRNMQPFKWPEQNIQVHKAPQRTAYRNRIQLHYRGLEFGMIESRSDSIIEIPECQIMHPELKKAYLHFLKHKKIPKGQPKEGHVEFYLKERRVLTSWNKPYAEGGFTQVNDQMNEVLTDLVHNISQSLHKSSLLDLFSGYGNLSHALSEDRFLVDASPPPRDKNLSYTQLNLFKEASLTQFSKVCPKESFDLMLVDPPRKGFPLLVKWVEKYQPKALIYVSCKASTMVRDLRHLPEDYQLEEVHCLDLFPSSYHYESLVVLKHKNA